MGQKIEEKESVIFGDETLCIIVKLINIFYSEVK